MERLYGWVERVVGYCTSISTDFAFVLRLRISRINPSTGVITKEYNPAHECVAQANMH
jgi:hypothetical protein